jgi:molecular chaperone GrpE
MSEKKNHKPQPEEMDEQSGEALQEKAGSTDQPELDSETLMKRLEEAEARVAEHLDGWQRAQAEFMNYKSRVQRDQEMLKGQMKGDIIKKVLPVLDDLERAMQNRPVEDAWSDGIQLIVRKLQSILESEGIQRIDAEGKPFDPAYHEAISHEASAQVASGHVIAVVQNGYMLGERVVRPALVRVAQ